ncbi:MAG TPA: glycosyltransferase [Anaerolineae bacterium]|nr:glycosyltransferase [Anaerolineae bacterium]
MQARKAEPFDVLWVGSRGGIEDRMVRSAGVEFIGLATGGVRGMGPLTALRNMAQILGSTAAAGKILRRIEPEVVLVTGGYACVPVTLAARVRQVPVLVYLPDVVPGLAVRWLSRLAAVVAVTCEESIPYLSRRTVVVTGYPVRPGIFGADRVQARRTYSLDPDLPALLVFGGSRGARSINQALVAGLPDLLPVCQVIHVSGELDASWVGEAARLLPEGLRHRYQHHAYLSDMPTALVAADLAVARAGAATMGEFPAAGLPSILVPYPHSGQHQEHNARYMERHGAARVLADGSLQERLVATVRAMLTDQPLLREMGSAAKAMARPDAAAAIAQQVRSQARHYARKGFGEPT